MSHFAGTAARYLIHHPPAALALAAVALFGLWRVTRPVPDGGGVHREGLAGGVATLVGVVVAAWYLVHQRAAAKPAAPPAPAPSPVTRVIVQHVTDHSQGLPGWAVPVMVIVAACIAGAVAINAGQRDSARSGD